MSEVVSLYSPLLCFLHDAHPYTDEIITDFTLEYSFRWKFGEHHFHHFYGLQFH